MIPAILPPHGELPPQDTIDIWLFRLESAPTESAGLPHLLSSDEEQRAARFRFNRDARRFRNSRSALRIALGHYLAQPGSELTLTTGAFGKPRLAAESPLRFNLAHSEDLAAIAFTTAGEVGIDIEAVPEAEISAASIAAGYFTPEEAFLVRKDRSTSTQVREFLRVWTRKEAILKAVGCGLFSALNSIDVARRNTVSFRAEFNDGIDSRWRVKDLELGCGFIGAVAGLAQDWVVRLWSSPNPAHGKKICGEKPRFRHSDIVYDDRA